MTRFCYFIILLLAAGMAACNGDEDFNALPRDISSFVTEYWPDPDVESYTHPAADKYVVIIRNGPRLTFGTDYRWTDIDGCGLPLPQVLLFNELPEPLYKYLEATEQLNAVFAISRTPRQYTLLMLDSEITYDIQTQAVHTEEPPFTEEA